jgi:hypothetical protein
MNESRYGALTGSSLVERLTAVNSPKGSGLGALLSGCAHCPYRKSGGRSITECWARSRSPCRFVLLLAVALPTIRRPLLLRSRPTVLLAALLAFGLVTLAAITFLDDWPASMFPRYVNPMLPLLAMFAAWAWTKAGLGQRALFQIAALSSVAVCLVWFYMGSAYYFTNVGAKLGIHAAGSS